MTPTAHLDIWQGPDDNGSGTAGVIELAHAFAATPNKPKRSILFVVFASEERGLVGPTTWKLAANLALSKDVPTRRLGISLGAHVS